MEFKDNGNYNEISHFLLTYQNKREIEHDSQYPKGQPWKPTKQQMIFDDDNENYMLFVQFFYNGEPACWITIRESGIILLKEPRENEILNIPKPLKIKYDIISNHNKGDFFRKPTKIYNPKELENYVFGKDWKTNWNWNNPKIKEFDCISYSTLG